MDRIRRWLILLVALVAACGSSGGGPPDGTRSDGVTIDPTTGIPFAYTFQFPVVGFDTSDYCFGFGEVNSQFCLKRQDDQCVTYGAHLGRDTCVDKTPVGTVVVAPADGIVRVSTDQTFGGYGSDSPANPDYRGCVLVLEHEFASGSPLTTLLGHVQCESATPYDPAAQRGNPPVGTIVTRGQYIGHVAHYWAGRDTSLDWHHVHTAARRGRFDASKLGDSVVGYADPSTFMTDPTTGRMTHPIWIDFFDLVAANGDPALAADASVRHHPPGSLLEDVNGGYWFVKDDTHLARIPNDVLAADRYDPAAAIRMTADEQRCYAVASDVSGWGATTLYKHAGSSAVAIAFQATKTRKDFIRWEALTSWGYGASDIRTDATESASLDASFADDGLERLRPGTLVKADESSEVSIVTPSQTRVPIASADIFEALGFKWERVVSIPQAVIDQVAGPRENTVIDNAFIHGCAVPSPCPGGGSCGGGGPAENDAGSTTPVSDAGSPSVEICNGLDDDGNGLIDEIFQCRKGAIDGPPCVSSCGTAGQRVCDGASCTWGSCRPMPENCANTIDDDCNGLIDCDDPTCMSDPSCVQGSDPDAGPSAVDAGATTDATIHLSYTGPFSFGPIVLQGWWQPPNAPPHSWGAVTACVDSASDDGNLDCTFSLPHETSSFEFQLDLPNGNYWGNESCSNGGCGTPIGTVMLTADGSPLTVSMVPNNTDGNPYFNGYVDLIP